MEAGDTRFHEIG